MSIRALHTTLGVIPFIWFVFFLLILTIGTIHFGYVPAEGNFTDPYKLNLDFLSFIHIVFLLLGILAFFSWIILTIIAYNFYGKDFSANKTATVLFAVGVTGYFAFRYFFTDTFSWVLD